MVMDGRSVAEALYARDADVARVPVPPTANKQWRTAIAYTSAGKPYPKTYLSHEARKWKQEAALRLARGLGRMAPKTPVCVRLRAGIDYRRDLDNCIKPILDALKDARVVPDDRYVDRIEAARAEVEGVEVRVVAI